MGKGTSRHLVQYGHFVQVFLGFSCAKNLWVKVPVAILFSTVTSYEVFLGFSCAKSYG